MFSTLRRSVGMLLCLTGVTFAGGMNQPFPIGTVGSESNKYTPGVCYDNLFDGVHGDNEYLLVQNSGAATLSAGMAVQWANRANHTVKRGTSWSQAICGIVDPSITVTVGTSDYCWIVTTGRVSADFNGDGDHLPTDGKLVYCSSATGSISPMTGSEGSYSQVSSFIGYIDNQGGTGVKTDGSAQPIVLRLSK